MDAVDIGLIVFVGILPFLIYMLVQGYKSHQKTKAEYEADEAKYQINLKEEVLKQQEEEAKKLEEERIQLGGKSGGVRTEESRAAKGDKSELLSSIEKISTYYEDPLNEPALIPPDIITYVNEIGLQRYHHTYVRKEEGPVAPAKESDPEQQEQRHKAPSRVGPIVEFKDVDVKNNLIVGQKNKEGEMVYHRFKKIGTVVFEDPTLKETKSSTGPDIISD